uniref:Uncharacterized protein n=1 Tax=Panagrellus redivivus TaxID=6233 RepID=A0A7E4VMY2_PANRE
MDIKQVNEKASGNGLNMVKTGKDQQSELVRIRIRSQCREERESLDTLGPEAATTTTHSTCFTGTLDTATATVTDDACLSGDATSTSRTNDTPHRHQDDTQRHQHASCHDEQAAG